MFSFNMDPVPSKIYAEAKKKIVLGFLVKISLRF